MATTSCKHCNYEPVADNAPYCPRCGGEKPGSRWWHVPLTLIGLGVIFGIGYTVINGWIWIKGMFQ